MENKYNLYDRYTSTLALANVDEKTMRKWSERYFRAHFVKLLPTDKDAKILEVGCGYGRYLKILADMGYANCYGIDISDEQVIYAKTNLDLSNVEKADALDWLNGKEAVFDCILILDVLEHLEIGYLFQLGERIYSSLKHGGRIVVQVPNALSPLNPHHYGDLTHVRAFTVQSIQQFFLHSCLIPIGYYEVPPYVYGVKSAVRKILWSLIVKPAIGIFIRIVHGNVTGGDIYTANLIAVAERK
jgi:2-polyprenyl-3-methyl-5-hydroxy-6-metoxy-1,4-benzoquinol methylase